MVYELFNTTFIIMHPVTAIDFKLDILEHLVTSTKHHNQKCVCNFNLQAECDLKET